LLQLAVRPVPPSLTVRAHPAACRNHPPPQPQLNAPDATYPNYRLLGMPLTSDRPATADYEEGVRVLDRLRQLAPQLQQFSGGYQHFLQLVVPAVSTRLRAEPVTLDGSSKLQVWGRASARGTASACSRNTEAPEPRH